MWTKDDYQEHMLGYLSEVQSEIERLTRSSLQYHDLDDLYTDLDIASERLWRLIGARDVDWEGLRDPLEVSCDDLLRAFYRVPRAGSLILSVSFIITENDERMFHSWKQAEMV